VTVYYPKVWKYIGQEDLRITKKAGEWQNIGQDGGGRVKTLGNQLLQCWFELITS
jgi:hypothetical protein